MQANPEINVVIPIYNSMSQFVVPALRLAGKTGQVKVATFNGTPFVLDYIQSGEADMDIGESLDWIAYATIDGHLRDACGLPAPTALNVPFYIFDKNNAADAGTPGAVRHRLRRRLQVGLPQALGPRVGRTVPELRPSSATKPWTGGALMRPRFLHSPEPVQDLRRRQGARQCRPST